ncbi:MAG: sel1 repeat family protein [Bacteroidales bacterium]|nr:sel1 repeat family protein [Bacteroidales bacterium]
MRFHEITTGSLYKVWEVRMTVAVSDDNIVFTECLFHPENQIRIEGRCLNIFDVPLFEKAAEMSKGNLERFLESRLEKDILSIDALQRLCERHLIKYELSGQRLVTAYRNSIKQLRDTEEERKEAGWKLCQKAWKRTHGRTPGTPKNLDMAFSLLKEAIRLGYLPANGKLAELYRSQGYIQEAVRIAEKGIKRGDAESMITLADMLSDETPNGAPKCDYKRAAELYIEACEKGYYYKATPGLRRLISRGNFTPKSNQYMSLIMFAAKRKSYLNNKLLDYRFFDPEVRVALNMVADGCTDEEKINEILVHAVEVSGKVWAYGYLTESYMRMQRWGKAAKAAVAGIEAGVISCFFHAARLAEMGADFTDKSDELSSPDYESAIKWAGRSVEEDDARGFVMLNHLTRDEHPELPAEISKRLEDFNLRTTDERRKHITGYTIDGHLKRNEK